MTGILVGINKIPYGTEGKVLNLAIFEIENFEESIMVDEKQASIMEKSLEHTFRILIKRLVMYNKKGEPRNAIAFAIGSDLTKAQPATKTK